MAAGSTYTPIATTTLGSAANSYTFSSIPQTYTDLVLQIVTFATSGAQPSGSFRVGAAGSIDTGANYSQTMMYGTGSSALSARVSSQNYGFWDAQGISASTTTPNFSTLNFQNYSNATTYKTIVGRASVADTGVVANVNLWRNTAAIDTIQVFNYTGYNMGIGTTLTLYGIAAA
jgi:hypothetical protein